MLRPSNKADNLIYDITAHECPNVMREIARLREISYRDGGGATGLSMDIDGISMKDQRTFLVTFKGVVEKMIRHAWKSVGRAASLWYDHKEDAEKEKMEDISI